MREELPILIFLGLALPLLVLAQITIENPLTAKTFGELINKIISFIFTIAVALVPLMIIIGAALFITSGGNISQVDRAKKIILYTVIGFAIVLLAKGIVALIEQLLGVK